MARRIREAWWATLGVFLVHGLVVSTWVSRIPAIKANLGLNDAVFGLTLLASAIGAICGIPLAGWLVNRWGSKKTTASSSLAFCMALVLPAIATNAARLGATLFAFGALAAMMDVSMNAQGVKVENQWGKPTMSRFHALFSVGGMAGAGVGGFVAAHNIHPFAHFVASSAVNLIAIASFSPFLLETHDHRLPSGQPRFQEKKIPQVLLVLSGIGFCILLSEGAMADWTAVYLRQVLYAGPGRAAAGYSVFSAAMAIFRFLGDLITARLGALRSVRAGSLVAAGGMLWALSAQSPGWALPGFAATGAGLSVIIPLVFGAGGRVKAVSTGAGIATVTGLGYLGFIAGPPTIGFASQLFTLRYALGIVVACCVLTSILSGFLHELEGSRPRQPVTELHR